ncbi:MAG: hypothetical protein RIT45_2922 [Pseudomonadota bacterium]|jgi:hypothetical protein
MSDLESRIAGSRRRLLEAAEDIRELLAADVAGYPDRELERRFLGQPEAAAALQDATLAELRRRASALGSTLGEAVRAALAEESVWLELTRAEALPAESKDLRDMQPIWSLVRDIVDGPFEELAAGHGLRDDDRQPAGYAPPRRFIDRRYLPALVEAVLREVVSLRGLEAEHGAAVAEQRKRTLAERWAAAKPE